MRLRLRPTPYVVFKVAQLSFRHVLKQLHEGVVGGDIEDILRVEAWEGLPVKLFADAEERQVALDVDSKQCFGEGTRRLRVRIPRGGQVLRRGNVSVTSSSPKFTSPFSTTSRVYLTVVPDSRARQQKSKFENHLSHFDRKVHDSEVRW